MQVGGLLQRHIAGQLGVAGGGTEQVVGARVDQHRRVLAVGAGADRILVPVDAQGDVVRQAPHRRLDRNAGSEAEPVGVDLRIDQRQLIAALRHAGEIEPAAGFGDVFERRAAAAELHAGAADRIAVRVEQAAVHFERRRRRIQLGLEDRHVGAESRQQGRVLCRDVNRLVRVTGDRVQLLALDGAVAVLERDVAPRRRAHDVPGVAVGARKVRHHLAAPEGCAAGDRRLQAGAGAVGQLGRAGVVEQRGEDVLRRDQVVARDARRHLSGPVEDQRGAEAELVERPLALAEAGEELTDLPTVVGEIDDQRVVAQVARLELGDHLADHRVEPGDVGVVVDLVASQPLAFVRRAILRRRVERRVRQRRRHPGEEGLVLRHIQEVAERLDAGAAEVVADAAEDRAARRIVGNVRRHPVREPGLREAAGPHLAAFPRQIAGALELARQRPHVLDLFAVRDAGAGAEQRVDRDRGGVPLRRMDAAEERAQRGYAEARRHVHVAEDHPLRRQGVEVGRDDLRIAHEARVRPAVVVADDEHDVGRGLGHRRGHRRKAAQREARQRTPDCPRPPCDRHAEQPETPGHRWPPRFEVRATYHASPTASLSGVSSPAQHCLSKRRPVRPASARG